jgi:hypothetical protein
MVHLLLSLAATERVPPTHTMPQSREPRVVVDNAIPEAYTFSAVVILSIASITAGMAVFFLSLA